LCGIREVDAGMDESGEDIYFSSSNINSMPGTLNDNLWKYLKGMQSDLLSFSSSILYHSAFKRR